MKRPIQRFNIMTEGRVRIHVLAEILGEETVNVNAAWRQDVAQERWVLTNT